MPALLCRGVWSLARLSFPLLSIRAIPSFVPFHKVSGRIIVSADLITRIGTLYRILYMLSCSAPMGVSCMFLEPSSEKEKLPVQNKEKK